MRMSRNNLLAFLGASLFAYGWFEKSQSTPEVSLSVGLLMLVGFVMALIGLVSVTIFNE